MRTTSSGVDGRSRRARSSAKPAAASGNACAGVQTEPGAAVSVPDPTTIASAHARRSPITKRSAALSAAISLFEEGTRRNRDHAVDRGDEVGEQPRLVEAE